MAEFYKGFAFELDVHGRLTVDGNPIPESPGTLAERAQAYIDDSLELQARHREQHKHLEILRQGRAEWNAWRRAHPEVHPMLADHDFTTEGAGIVLDDYDFSYTNFTQARLDDISMRRANFHQAILAKASLVEADLQGANFCRTDFYETNLAGADLSGANLQGVQLARTNMAGAHLRRCRVYGLSAWDVMLDGADESDLLVIYEDLLGGQRVSRDARVKSIDLAALMYLTLQNRNIARIISATTDQWVLLLGRFKEHKDVLDTLAAALLERHYIPVVFDFERASERDLIETIILLAGLSRLVIVDITDPRSTPLELHAIVPNFSVPVVPIMRRGTRPFGVFSGLLKFPWVRRPPIEYADLPDLVGQLDGLVAAPLGAPEATL